MTRAIIAAASALLVSACSILPEAAPADIYRLSRPAAAGSEQSTREYGAPTVMISLPAANRAVGGNNIVISRPDGSMAVASGVRWASPARNLVQDVIIETFETDAAGVAPLRPGDGIAGDYDLSIDLRHFEAEYDRGMESAPLVRVSVGARLISEARELQGSTVLSSNARAADNTMGAIVAAFSRSTAEVSDALTQWTVERVEAARARDAAIAAAEERGEVSIDVDLD